MLRTMPTAGRAIGPHPLGIDYPFVSPEDSLRRLVGDFYLSFESLVVPPLKISWLYGLAQYFYEDGTYPGDSEPLPYTPTHDADVIVTDATDTIVFDSRQAAGDNYLTQPFGDRLRIHEWQTDSAICRLVQHTAFEDPEDAVAFPASIQPTQGELDARTYEPLPARVQSLRVGLVQMAGHVRFLSGFNCVLTPDETKLSGLQRVTKLTLSATPGSGLGRYPGCESPDIVIREINGQRPDEHGRFLLSATGCYWVRQPQNTVPGARNLLALEPATLQIGNDCGPCCVCDDYVRVYKGLRRVWQTYKEIGQRAVATRDQLAANILRFEESKACRQNRILSVQALPHNGNKVELLAAVCNASGDCTLNVELRLRVTVNNQKFPPDLPADALAPTVDCGSVLLSGDRGLEPSPIALVDGAYVGFWDYVDPGQTATMRLRISVPYIGPATSVTACVTATVDGVAVPEDPDYQEDCVTVGFPHDCEGGSQ